MKNCLRCQVCRPPGMYTQPLIKDSVHKGPMSNSWSFLLRFYEDLHLFCLHVASNLNVKYFSLHFKHNLRENKVTQRKWLECRERNF